MSRKEVFPCAYSEDKISSVIIPQSVANLFQIPANNLTKIFCCNFESCDDIVLNITQPNVYGDLDEPKFLMNFQ